MSRKLRREIQIARIRDLMSAALFEMADDATLHDLLSLYLSLMTQFRGFRLIGMTSNASRQCRGRFRRIGIQSQALVAVDRTDSIQWRSRVVSNAGDAGGEGSDHEQHDGDLESFAPGSASSLSIDRAEFRRVAPLNLTSRIRG